MQHPLPVEYKDIKLDCGYRIDMLVDEKVIVELKSVDKILPIHQAQLLTYMKLSGIGIGLLMNFNVVYMKTGIKRMVL
jgi:GxxExxY protein